MTIRAVDTQETFVLRVDAAQHAAEVARFTRFVVPRPRTEGLLAVDRGHRRRRLRPLLA